ncbi:LysR family transcriptional regulator [Terrihabitans sp. B22-R8]|uniref:LysR family transcriptional regulator n=1 Tax=Terrihabitans sp. B22-R8 TaxID=3425128 RepID=UPI00403C4722
MRRYTLQQLEAFQAVRETRSFSLAADKLGITQPSMSLRIRDLERALGCKLFERGKKGVELAESGRAIADYVKRGLTVLDEMTTQLESGNPLTGTLSLGASNTFAQSCLPTVLSELERRHRNLRVEVTVSNSHTLADLLHDRKLDIAFMMTLPGTAELVVEPMAISEIDWFGSPKLFTANVRAEDLARQRIITLPAPSPFHTIIVNWFAKAKLPLPSFSTCNDMATMIKLVRSGSGVSILPLSILDEEMLSDYRPRMRNAPKVPPLRLSAAFHPSLVGKTSELLLELAAMAIIGTKSGLTLDRQWSDAESR